MKKVRHRIEGTVMVYPGGGGWRFLPLPLRTAKRIRAQWAMHARAWGSLPVEVTLGKSVWNTSLFPDTRSGTYLLPLKAEVRRKERVADGDTVACTVRVLG